MATEAVAANLFSWKDAAGQARVLNADVVMSARDTRSATLTDHVVEDGSLITDHVVIQPETLSLEVVVTQTPIKLNTPGMEVSDTTIQWQYYSFEQQNYPIEVRKSQFTPGGFLLLTTAVRGVVTAVADAALGTVGLGGGSSSLPTQMRGSRKVINTNSTSHPTLQATGAPVDRVAAVHDTLVQIMYEKRAVSVSFKGRLYKDYLMTQIQLSETEGKFGSARISVDLRAFRTVQGSTAELPAPSDFRAQGETQGGNKKAVAKTDEADKALGNTRLEAAGVGFANLLTDVFGGFSRGVEG